MRCTLTLCNQELISSFESIYISFCETSTRPDKTRQHSRTKPTRGCPWGKPGLCGSLSQEKPDQADSHWFTANGLLGYHAGFALDTPLAKPDVFANLSVEKPSSRDWLTLIHIYNGLPSAHENHFPGKSAAQSDAQRYPWGKLWLHGSLSSQLSVVSSQWKPSEGSWLTRNHINGLLGC